MAARGARKPLQPQTLPLFSGRLEICSVHSEQQGAAAGVPVVSFAYVKHNPDNRFLITIVGLI